MDDLGDLLDVLTPPALLDITVYGDPAPQGSKRYLGVGSQGRVRMAESSKRVEPWRADIRAAIERKWQPVKDAGGRLPYGGPVTVHLEFYLLRPAGHWGTGRNSHLLRPGAPSHPHGKPDVDKLARAVLDAIGSTGLVWADDAQVVQLSAIKIYCPRGGQPGCHITVRSAS